MQLLDKNKFDISLSYKFDKGEIWIVDQTEMNRTTLPMKLLPELQNLISSSDSHTATQNRNKELSERRIWNQYYSMYDLDGSSKEKDIARH